MSNKTSAWSKRPRRPKARIEPIHVEELLDAPGMSGFLGVLGPPVRADHLQQLASGTSTVPPKALLAPSDSNITGIALGRLSTSRNASSEITARAKSVVSKINSFTELIKTTNKRHDDPE